MKLDGYLVVELPDPDLAPGLAIGLHVPVQDVLVEAQPERVLLEAARVGRVVHVRLGPAGAQRLDGLDEVIDGQQRVQTGHDGHRQAQMLGHVVEDVGAGAEGVEEHVQGARDDEREPGLVVSQVDEILRTLSDITGWKVQRTVPAEMQAVQVLVIDSGQDAIYIADEYKAGVDASDPARLANAIARMEAANTVKARAMLAEWRKAGL